MNIVVIGGSPKGDISITMQYVKYIEENFPDHNFQYLQAAQKIKAILKNIDIENEFFKMIEQADIILWAFPLYYLSVHGNYKRFIELCFDKYKHIFKGKYAASISTSIHFYDHTAHNYIHAVSDDLGMQFISSFSPKMDDLLHKKGEDQTKQFAGQIFYAAAEKLSFPKQYPKLNYINWEYKPAANKTIYQSDQKIVIVQDQTYSSKSNIGKMILQYRDAIDGDVEIVDLAKIKINGGCLGCLKCGADNRCAYEGKDEYIEMFRTSIMTADVLVWAGEIKDRYLSWQWKQFLDRSFFNTHQPVMQDKQFLFLISGPFSQNSNLREIIASYVEVQGGNLVNIISDESNSSSDLDSQIDTAVGLSISLAEKKYININTFRGVAGMKVFRDDIFDNLKIVFKGDHRVYKKNKYYDYKEHRIFRRLIMGFLYAVTSIPFIKKQMYSNMPKMMITRYQKVLNKQSVRS